MKVKPIENPANDEQVLAVHPKLAPNVVRAWRKRLNFYTGRSLSDVALITEQDNRAGRLALRGQLLSPGVISGLDVGLELNGANAAYYISAGVGLAASGEDVFVARDWQVAYDQIPVYGPAAFFDGGTAGGDSAWRMGPTLAEVRTNGLVATAALILVLQPVTLSRAGEFDPLDPCAVNPDDDAFADWQIVDGCRLVYHLWPEQEIPMPLPGDRWRNRLAYAIFQHEQQLALDELMPWSELGVPVGLVGLDNAGLPSFVDSHAVVRAGGKPKQRTPLVAGSGSQFHWQARMQQSAEHLAELVMAQVATPEIATNFRYMPPAGLLPKDAAAPRQQQSDFFPPNYTVDAVPVPLEQLDLALESSAGLAPYDFDVADQLRILVPVPQIWYEPDLLEVLTVDPEFQDTIDEYEQTRGQWLARREDVRTKASLLVEAVTGDPVSYPSPDPKALEPNEQVAADLSETFSGTVAFPNRPTHTFHALVGQEVQVSISSPSGGANFAITGLRDGQPLKRLENEDRDWSGTITIEQDYLITVAMPGSGSEDYTLTVTVSEAAFGISLNPAGDRVVDVVTELKNFLHLNTPLRSETSVAITGVGQVTFPPELEGKARFDDDTNPTRLFWQGYMSENQQGILNTLLPNNPEEVSNLFNQAASLEVSVLDQEGLEDFITLLQRKVDSADDEIDFGFVRAQTDIYRVRQLMLDDLSATRLATSPALASIAQGKSAVATRDNIRDYIKLVRSEGDGSSPTAPQEETPPEDDGGPGPAPLAEPILGLQGSTTISGGSRFISSELSGESTSSNLILGGIGGNVILPGSGAIQPENPILGGSNIGILNPNLPIFPTEPVLVPPILGGGRPSWRSYWRSRR